ncbi:Ni/Fe-hydrogenase 1 B-type cytochrome subunit [Flexibacter flexilis DSM 6793]|uniref:Ni/Fe-hydrogenase 1 B-type cytochrome subunit n=1 Tax=Flexibacter flexilis DSM 6793 TaxID=927664 RepID=A0A1I1I635_9BACT|nr:Ni/Fe-hydrogenase, b-type cytochrome subunit [Flexibacter flexilis]SFC31674.1 Ni/Fe-hydrogenase 1 B-type cytochrome subunit [Flexibacter flexilis DSM 6793]
MESSTFKRAYVWQLPVRLFHWINAFSITILIITGFIIANPPALMSNKEASEQFWFGYVRQIHFISAYLMVAVMVLRLYYAFFGNRYANWRVMLPLSKSGFSKMWHVIKYDLLLQNEKEYNFKNISTGHNAVAAFSYFIMFILAVVMVFTGFGLYAPTSTWFLPRMFEWVPAFLGGDFVTRTVHHYSMWAFILFVVVHVYLVFFHDWLEGRGETSAMFSGYKFVRTESIKDEEAANAEKKTA